jgi:anti-anti-sigma regulatory factor
MTDSATRVSAPSAAFADTVPARQAALVHGVSPAGRGVQRQVTKKKPAEQSTEQRAARSVLFGDVSACKPNAEIRLSGDLAADTVGDLGSQLAALIRTGHRQLLVDGRGLSQVSPVCVEVFNRAVSCLLPLGGQLILTGLSNADADRLRSAGLDGAIRVTYPPTGPYSGAHR